MDAAISGACSSEWNKFPLARCIICAQREDAGVFMLVERLAISEAHFILPGL